MNKLNKEDIINGIIKVGGVVGLGGFLFTCGVNSEKVEIRNNYHEYINNTRTTPLFSEYKRNHALSLIEAYKRGEITTQELSERLTVLDSVEFVFDNRNVLMSPEEVKKVEDLKSQLDTYSTVVAISAATAATGGLVSLMTYVADQKRKNPNKEDKPKRKISFESGCSCAACTEKLSVLDQNEFEF